MTTNGNPIRLIIDKVKTNVGIVWFSLTFLTALSKVLGSHINNYYIYEYVYYHTIHLQNLFIPDSAYYQDVNHYGPLFSFVIAPFAILQDTIGPILWMLLNSWLLYYAINRLPFEKNQKNMILWLILIEMMTTVSNMQFNGAIAALLVVSFLCVREGKDGTAAFLILFGFWIKLYTIVGLVFFFFSKNKLRFVLWSCFWAVILFAAPMLISSPSFILQTYRDWYDVLIEKNIGNLRDNFGSQNISVFGVCMYVFHIPEEYLHWVMVGGALLCMMPYIRFRQWGLNDFQLSGIASIMMFVVLFSTGSESSTYIIALTGAAIWIAHFKNSQSKWITYSIMCGIVLTSLCPTDVVPEILKHDIIRPYRIKAIVPTLIWLYIIYHSFFRIGNTQKAITE